MADDKRSAPGQRVRRSRPTPTIDLTATEVPSEKSEVAEAEVAPQAAASGTDDTTQASETASSDPAAETRDRVDSPPPRRLGYVAAASAGAILAAVIAIVLSLSGYIPVRGSDADVVKSQLAALQTTIDMVADIKQRLGRIEQAAAQPDNRDPGVSERLATIENSLKALGVSLTALNQRTDAATKALQEARGTQSTAFDALSRRVAELEQAAKATQDKVAHDGGSDGAARRALAALALRDAVVRDAPYSVELTALQTLGADRAAVAALQPFAASGIPSDAMLSRGLKALLPKMIEAAGAGPSRTRGFLEALEVNASRLVRVRPVGEPVGDEPSALFARIETKLARDDAAGAAGDVRKLPEKARTVADAWLKTVAAKDAALAASRSLAADSAGALGTK